MSHRAAFGLAAAGLIALASGCQWRGRHAPAAGSSGELASSAAMANPYFTPICDREFLWNQIVDTIDDDFKIERETRVRVIGNEVLKGRIQTFPTTGSTLLEPWRRDSTPGFEKLHSTLQSVRRWAEVEVSPAEGGYLVEVAVFKELEDLERPEHATVGVVTTPHEGSPARGEPAVVGSAVRLGWIPLGRDVSLEQRILLELHGRLADGAPGAHTPNREML
jgi:hypothetical protein